MFRRIILVSQNAKSAYDVQLTPTERPHTQPLFPEQKQGGVNLCIFGFGPKGQLGDFWDTQLPEANDVLARLKNPPVEFSPHRYFDSAHWG